MPPFGEGEGGMAASRYTAGNMVARSVPVIMRQDLLSPVLTGLERHDSAQIAAGYSAVE